MGLRDGLDLLPLKKSSVFLLPFEAPNASLSSILKYERHGVLDAELASNQRGESLEAVKQREEKLAINQRGESLGLDVFLEHGPLGEKSMWDASAGTLKGLPPGG